jgi:septum site-determining protein MinD
MPSQNDTRIIGVISGKGGVGKTTVVSNLGAVLAAEYKKSVTVLDCNFTTSHLGLYLGLYQTPITLNTVLQGKANLEDAIYSHKSGMKVVPAGLSVNDLKGVDLVDVEKVVRKLVKKTDFVFLDAAAGLGREAVVTMRASDEALFVTIPQAPSAVDIMRCHKLVQKYGKTALGVVLNMVQGKAHEFSALEIESLTDLPVVAKIPYDPNFHKALADRRVLLYYRPNSKAMKSYRQLAAWLCGVEYKERPLLSRIANWLKYR